MRSTHNKIIIDAREFTNRRFTGIGRVLEGLTGALAESDFVEEIILAVSSTEAVPDKLRNRNPIKIAKIPCSFLQSEKALAHFGKNDPSLFISPYPKLPIFGIQCPALNTVHDILYLTHAAYKRRFRQFFDGIRLRISLKQASLTWYDSSWSLDETQKYVGFVGLNPKVRYPGISARFSSTREKNDKIILDRYHLQAGYIIVVGNGLPHKNLGVLLTMADKLSRQMVFVGVSEQNQRYWRSRYKCSQPVWIAHVDDEDLPSIIRGAFCLAQPSTAEGYGYPPLEAMASGVPAVVSNIPVLVETTGGRAITADHDNPNAWVEAIETIENKDYYQTQVDKGLRWVDPLKGQKGWEKHVFDIEELIRRRKK